MNDSIDLPTTRSLRLDPALLAQPVKSATELPSLTSRRPKRIWCKLDYELLLQLADEIREPTIVVLAELCKRQYKARLKGEERLPVELPNTGFKKLGFDHHAKIRALKTLEKLGAIGVIWRPRQSPKVYLSTHLFY